MLAWVGVSEMAQQITLGVIRFNRMDRSVRMYYKLRMSGTVLVMLMIWPAIAGGQQKEYTVSWLGIPVVDIEVLGVSSDLGREVTYHAVTRRWFNTIYSLDNRYTVELLTGRANPWRYSKQILERGHSDSLSVRYDDELKLAVYSNDLVRVWEPTDHNLFSSLLWLEERQWKAGEQYDVRVAIEGVTWEVAIQCDAVMSNVDIADEARVTVTFIEPVAGEPVLSSTDMLTHLLPGIGHRLRIGLDMAAKRIMWIEFGRQPFMIRARLNEPTS